MTFFCSPYLSIISIKFISDTMGLLYLLFFILIQSNLLNVFYTRCPVNAEEIVDLANFEPKHVLGLVMYERKNLIFQEMQL